MTTPEPPEPPLRELSAFVGATRPARSRKERIEMTTPEPSPLAPKELDELEGKLSRLTRSCQCEECRDERSAIRESLRRLIAQARAARPSPWQPMETAPHVNGETVLLWWPYWNHHHAMTGYWGYDQRWHAAQALEGDYVGPTHWQPLPSPPSQDGGRP